MVATTYEARPAATEAVAPNKSFLRRFFDAMIEARMVQAQREMRAFRHLVPHADSSVR